MEQKENNYTNQVERKYSEFEELDQSLKAVSKMFPHFSFPRVPSWFRLSFFVGRNTSYIIGDLTQEEINERKTKLTDYLRLLESNQIARSTPFFFEFLNLSPEIFYQWVNNHGGYISYDKHGIPRKKFILLESKANKEENINEDEKSFEINKSLKDDSIDSAIARNIAINVETMSKEVLLERNPSIGKKGEEITDNSRDSIDKDNCDISDDGMEESNNDEEESSFNPQGKSIYPFFQMKLASGILQIHNSSKKQ